MSSSAKPTLLLVHGAWHTPECFSGIQPKLESLSYPIATVQLPSSGGPPSTTWKDDVKAILDVALPLMDEGKEVVIICHSYGGIPGTASTQGQSIEERAKLGKKGGFKAILFIAAFAIPVRGMTLKQTFGGVYPPWFTEKDGMAVPGPGAKEAFYSGANDEEAEAMLKKCNNHTMAAFETPVDFVASDLTIARTYMICETDQIMVLPFQEQLVAAVPGMKSQRCTAGHSPFLTMPDRTVEVIVSVADE